MYIIELFFASVVYIFGITFGLLLSGYTIKDISREEMEEEHKKEIAMIQYTELLNFQYLYEDELTDLSLNPVDNPEILKNTIIQYDVPLNSVIMYYDHSGESFCYYTKFGDVSYKYLNVVCRKYVIDNNCKVLYKEGEEPAEPITETNMDGVFFQNKKKTVLVREYKIINKFIHLGGFEDYYKLTNVVKVSNLSFMDYFSKK